ncbi:MAG: cytochrome c1 [Rhodospirillales bacterium]|nr:cytochrome c1 [Rhodospirillales bacterium]
MKTSAAALAFVATVMVSGTSFAAGDTPRAPAQNWSFNKLFGSFEPAAAQRGFQVYKEVCSGCHSMSLLSYRHLSQLGFSEDEVKAIAASVEVTAGPNDEGEMFERPGIPADRFKAPFANVQAAAAANNGKAPPDLSLMTKARVGGADYVYGLLVGYEEAPSGVEVPEGGNYNKYFPGHVIAMGPPLSDESVEYTDGTKPTLSQHAKDVTTFMAWAAEPEMEARKRMGVKVLLFLLVLTGMLYAVKRKVWENLH